ncbi:branched-chain amino acid ABC transporter substrate-binding protein [Comamonadaceae bacterium M7527]|nr:branched-chain amino acid ABC transporter substrate-binding protein [Comamonadaceae bacterium M7527]
MRFGIKTLTASLAIAGMCSAFAQSGETVKIAFIDPLSGPFANVGQNQLQSWRFIAEKKSGANNAAGVNFEMVAFDNKGSPQESLTALKAAIDQGIQYVAQGNGSGAAAAISQAVAKHNSRNPGKEVVFLNYAAVDPSLTNEACNYWHFRLDADTSMKMQALTSFMADEKAITKVYVIGQNYSHGKQVSEYFKKGISRKRPDIEIVGDELHPIAQVKDFAPYVAKIKQSGANAIVTGNWGTDLTLLVKALNDAGMTTPLYTYYAPVTGTPTALAGGSGQVYVVSYAHSNHTGELGELSAEFKKRFNDDYYTYATFNGVTLLGDAMAKVKSTDPVKVAKAMENLTIKGFNGDSTMRADDHQLQQGMWISKWQKTDGKYAYSVENTGYTFAPVKYLDLQTSSTATTCDMKRP